MWLRVTSEAPDDRRELGRAIKHRVLGVGRDSPPPATGDLFNEFQDWLDSCVWGEIWTRPGLDLRTRSAVTVAVLIALRSDEEQLVGHMRGGLRNGLSVAELVEVILHTAAYAGAPAARRAVRLAREVAQAEVWIASDESKAEGGGQ